MDCLFYYRAVFILRIYPNEHVQRDPRGTHMREFSLSAGQISQLSAIYFIANVIFLFPAGSILDRFSTRKVILTSMSICIAGTFLFSLSTSLFIAGCARFFTGIGSAFCFLSCIRLASRWFPAQTHGAG